MDPYEAGSETRIAYLLAILALSFHVRGGFAQARGAAEDWIRDGYHRYVPWILLHMATIANSTPDSGLSGLPLLDCDNSRSSDPLEQLAYSVAHEPEPQGDSAFGVRLHWLFDKYGVHAAEG